MDQNLMTVLSALLAGQSKTQPMAPMASPPMMQPMAQMPMTSQRTPQVQRPLAASENPNIGGGPGGYGDNGGRGNGGGGKGDGRGGKGGGNNRPSKLEKLENRIGNKGPTAYTNPIQKNLSMNKNTIGYGKADPSAFKTGMASILSGVPTAAPAPQPLPDDQMQPRF